jgi:mannitol-specific phosphotransferase system IIBC component
MAESIPASEVKVIIFVCEAGIGSSLMGVNSLKKKLKKKKISDVTVIHKPARQVPDNAQVIICHQGLAKMVRQRVPGAVVVAFKQFLNDPAFDRVINAIENGTDIVAEG